LSPANQDLFNKTKGNSNSSEIFSHDLISIFSEKINQYLRTFALQVQNIMEPSRSMHPSSSRAFQRDQEHDLKHPGSVDLISTKQNKQTTFLPYIVA
jgi:hypothetical protein